MTPRLESPENLTTTDAGHPTLDGALRRLEVLNTYECVAVLVGGAR